MRRSDREITDRTDIDRIIHGSQVCHLAFAQGDEPYVIPISFGYDGKSLYFHTARRGRKIDFIAANPRVCFQLERDVKLITDPEDPCEWSFSFESAVGYGTISEIASPEERIHALSQIMVHYSGREWAFEPADLGSVKLWRLVVDRVTGKRSRHDGV